MIAYLSTSNPKLLVCIQNLETVSIFLMIFFYDSEKCKFPKQCQEAWSGTILSLFNTLSPLVLIETWCRGMLVVPCHTWGNRNIDEDKVTHSGPHADCSSGALNLEHTQKWSGMKQRGWKWKCTHLLLSYSEGHLSPAA